MGFTFFFFVSWIAVTLLWMSRKKLSFAENTCVYLVVLIVSINWNWIVYEELKLVELTKQPLGHTAFLLNRSIIVPAIVVLAVNLIRSFDSPGRKLLVVSLSAGLLVALAAIGSSLHITDYAKWNHGYDALYFLALHAVGLLAQAGFRRLGRRHSMEGT